MVVAIINWNLWYATELERIGLMSGASGLDVLREGGEERTYGICEAEHTGCFDTSAYVFNRGMHVANESGTIVDVGEVACGEDLETGHDALAYKRVDTLHGSHCSDRSDRTVFRENCGTCGGKLQDLRWDHPWGKMLGRPICHPSICH